MNNDNARESHHAVTSSVCLYSRRPRHNDIKNSFSLRRYAYVPAMSLCCVVRTGDIKHQREAFFAFA